MIVNLNLKCCPSKAKPFRPSFGCPFMCPPSSITSRLDSVARNVCFIWSKRWQTRQEPDCLAHYATLDCSFQQKPLSNTKFVLQIVTNKGWKQLLLRWRKNFAARWSQKKIPQFPPKLCVSAFVCMRQTTDKIRQKKHHFVFDFSSFWHKLLK